MDKNDIGRILIVVAWLLLGFVIGQKFNCHECPITGRVTIDTVYEVSWLTPTVDTVKTKGAVILVQLPSVTDTVIVVQVDTLFKGLPAFRLMSDNFITTRQDTITTQYEYPANKFVFQARYSPDTTTKINRTEYILPSRFQVGFQVGVGATVSVDGIMRPGAYVGLGLNFKL